MDELLAQIAAGKLAAVYVLSSDHPILIDRVVAALRDAAVPPALRGFNYDVVEGKLTSSRIINMAQTLPMMAAKRMVYVRDLAGLATDDSDGFLEYVASPNPSTVLVAVTSKLDKRLKLYSTLGKRGFLHVLSAPRQVSTWLRNEAAARNIRIDGAAITRLLDAIGDDLSRLAVTLDQLRLFAGDRSVTAADVDELVADTRERSVFELTDALGSASLGAALTAVHSLCEQRESAVGVVAMLARFVRQMSGVHHARAQGAAKSELPTRLGVPPFIVDKVIAQAKHYSLRALEQTSRSLALADRALKGDPTIDLADQSSSGLSWTGAIVKTLGRELAERAMLEALVTDFVGRSG
jgi:DNA polymerase III subunit delta